VPLWVDYDLVCIHMSLLCTFCPVIIDLTLDDSDDTVDVVPGPIVIDLTGDSDDDLH
jgi:hypothetical protein